MPMRRAARRLTAVMAATCLLGVAALAAAQPPPPPPLPKQARAVRVHGRQPHLDGKLDDEVWRQAVFIADFAQKEPVQGAPPGDPTEVGFLYDDDALYMGARMHSRDAASIRGLVGRRDAPGNTERIILTLDTYHDRRTAYSFAISATGVRSDYYHSTDNEYDRDHSYAPVWEGRTAIDSLGWTAEVRIPFSQLRFNRTHEQVWGLNLNRWVPQNNEDDFWIFVPRDQTGWASRFGELVGIAGVRPSRRIELLPYVAGTGTFDRSIDDNDPFHDQREFEGRAGTDLKMGLGPNLTLDGTVNPDFGQVEADPAVINLSQFETIFDERRPFFIEGSRLLGGSGPAYYYSRRIGAAPPGSASGDYVEQPATTTILGAAKVTGRLASGLSLGGQAAFTDREYADTFDATTQVKDRTQVAARTAYGVMRLQQEFGPAQSTLGLSLTGVSRDLHAGDALANGLPLHAYTGGTDWLLRFRGGNYQLGGSAGFSWVEGSPDAMLRLQRSSAHYFQRPDAGHVEIDPERTSLGGWTTNLNFERRGGGHWLGSAGVNVESPGFELNDAGRLSSADDIDSYVNLRYRETEPGHRLRDYDLRLTYENNFNFGGVRKYYGAWVDTDWTWVNFHHTFVGVGVDLGGLNDDQTRGGPLFRTARGWGGEISHRNNFASTLQWTAQTGYWQNELHSYSAEAALALSTRAGNRLELSATPGYERTSTARQYVTTRPGGPEETFGTRYIFARIDRSELRLQARVNYSFTPDLTLEVYAEPFAASGDYYDFGEMRAARSNDLLLYGTEGTTIERDADDNLTITDGPDTLYIPRGEYPGNFLELSYRSNVVLRWEWRRGSTLYFIWQKNRADAAPTGRSVRASDLWDAFTAPGQDVLAVKATYWLPVD